MEALFFFPLQAPEWRPVRPLETCYYYAEWERPFPGTPKPPTRLERLGPWTERWGLGVWIGRNGVKYIPHVQYPGFETKRIDRHRLVRQHVDYDGSVFRVEMDVFCREADIPNAKKLFKYACRDWPRDDRLEGNGEWQQISNPSWLQDGTADRQGSRYFESVRLVESGANSDVMMCRRELAKLRRKETQHGKRSKASTGRLDTPA